MGAILIEDAVATRVKEIKATMTRNMHRVIHAFLTISFLIIISASFVIANDHPDLSQIHQLIESHDYDGALILATELGRSDQCDRDCRAECHLLSGYCRFMVGQETAAKHELDQSIRLRPKHRLDMAEYPDGFLELYERVRKQALCSLEIRVVSKQSLAVMADEDLSLVYRMEDVPVGWISLSDNKYGRPQRYQLSAGRLNVFDLKLDELHDYWAFDSLNISFRPTMRTSTGDGKSSKSTSEKDKNKIGKYILELTPQQYSASPVSRITVGDSLNLTSLTVFESKPAWKKLHRDLASNHARRSLTRGLKVVSLVGMALTGIWAWQSHAKATDTYDEYMLEIDRVKIASLYRDYEGLIEKRNVTGGLSIVMAAVAVSTFIFKPGDEKDLIEEYERHHGPAGISLGVGADGVKLQLELGV